MFAHPSSLNSLRFTNRLALNSFFKLIKLLSANGDGEIRTHDPLLARQVLSQLSYAPINSAATYFPTGLPLQYPRPDKA